MDENQKDLNNLKVPLADLRWEIVQLMKDGFSEYPLGDFMLLIQRVIKKSKDES